MFDFRDEIEKYFSFIAYRKNDAKAFALINKDSVKDDKHFRIFEQIAEYGKKGDDTYWFVPYPTELSSLGEKLNLGEM